MQAIYDTLKFRLETLRKKGNAITLSDISVVLDDVAHYLADDKSEANTLLQDEIVKIANHIDITKKELVSLVPKELENKNISQLETVIKGTEEAVGTILDAADEILKTVNASDASRETKSKIQEITTRIYEASNFQDLAGQRIAIVMRELEFVEAKIRSLIHFFSSGDVADIQECAKTKDTRADHHLMNGPQLPGEGTAQVDVDALFKKM